MSDSYLGEIRMFGGTYAPLGWNLCDGTVLPISGNEALYSVIGNTYGGDGVQNFALPDLRGRAPMHRQQGQFDVGASGGAESVSLTPNNLPTHTHTFTVLTNDSNQSTPKGNYLSGSTSVTMFDSANPSSAMDPSTILPAGGSAMPHENMQPFQCVNFIISLNGNFPSR